jgi:hypothetical protein
VADQCVRRSCPEGCNHLVAVATGAVLALALLWPDFSLEARPALIAAALSIPANAAIRLNGSLAVAIRRFALAYRPDTCIRPFVLLGVVLVLIALGVTLTASNVTLLLTAVFTGLALTHYLLLRNDMPKVEAAVPQDVPSRLIGLWRREAMPLILVALFTYSFADVDILIVTPVLASADTAVVGICLKLALLVGFAVQVAHQSVVPDLNDAHTRKEHGAMGAVVLRALGFPLAVTLAALLVVVLWGETLLSLFGPAFTGAKVPAAHLACLPARPRAGRSERAVADGHRGAEAKCGACRLGARRAGCRQPDSRAGLWRAWRGDRGSCRHSLLAGDRRERARPAWRAQDRCCLSAWPVLLGAPGASLGRSVHDRLDGAHVLGLVCRLLSGEYIREDQPQHERDDDEEGDGLA